jgi:hypothetical protein
MENREEVLKGSIVASPKALADFFKKCNTDSDFRKEFLDKPIITLQNNDIIVGYNVREEIRDQVNWLKENFAKEIGIVPDWGEYGAELLENGWGIWIKAEKDPGAIP